MSINRQNIIYVCWKVLFKSFLKILLFGFIPSNENLYAIFEKYAKILNY